MIEIRKIKPTDLFRILDLEDYDKDEQERTWTQSIAGQEEKEGVYYTAYISSGDETDGNVIAKDTGNAEQECWYDVCIMAEDLEELKKVGDVVN